MCVCVCALTLYKDKSQSGVPTTRREHTNDEETNKSITRKCDGTTEFTSKIFIAYIFYKQAQCRAKRALLNIV